MTRHFPAETRMTQPQGGFVLWLELPWDIDATALREKRWRRGTPFVPGGLSLGQWHVS